MTGRDDELLPEGVPAFGDPAYDGLRAELADLQDVGPMPADVAARLDDVLADLGGTPAAAEPLTDAPVVPLRRRSNAGKRLLVAAAAVVAVGGGGIGLANVVDGGMGSDDRAASADSAVAESAPNAAADEAAPGVDHQSGGGVSSGRSALELRSQNFSADAAELITSDVELVTQLRRAAMAASTKHLRDKADNDSSEEQYDADVPLGASGGAPLAPTAPTDRAGAQDNLSGLNALQSCAVRTVTGGVARPVLLDGSPAILVVYPAVDGTRLVQARTCDANTVLISAFVPVP